MVSFHSIACTTLSQDQSCPICLENFVPNDAVVVHDGTNGSLHPFHTACIKKCVAIRPNCPVCIEPLDPSYLRSRSERFSRVVTKVATFSADVGIWALLSQDLSRNLKKIFSISLESVASFLGEPISSPLVTTMYSLDRRHSLIKTIIDSTRYVWVLSPSYMKIVRESPLGPLAGIIAGIYLGLRK